MPIGINPLASPSTGGAVGDLGMSSAAQLEAKAIAEKLKKKKQADQQAAAQANPAAGPGSVMSDLMKGMF